MTIMKITIYALSNLYGIMSIKIKKVENKKRNLSKKCVYNSRRDIL